MGEKDVARLADTRGQQDFMRYLLEDLHTLERLLDAGLLETDRRRIGAEQELFLIDEALDPCHRSLDVLAGVSDPRLTTELGLFNLEANLDPRELSGDCLRQMEVELDSLVETARQAAGKLGADVLLTGILPTLTKEHVTEDAMTPLPRYRTLASVMRQVRGAEFRTHIKGMDELHETHDNVMLEACNTSFQIHFQVSPQEFPSLYNLAQVVTAPTLAVAVNSPCFLQRRLWHETRVALFQQSIDTRSATHTRRGGHARVSFGNAWVQKSVLEIFREDVARFRVLVSTDHAESSADLLDRGEMPSLKALRLHNSTVYRWNRPCYGLTEGRPHLRIENRALPSGPTVLDEVANAAFYFGLMCGLSHEHPDVTTSISFDDAKANFLAAARYGLNARFRWLDGRSHGSVELIRDRLLPLAEEGLRSRNVDAADASRYLGVIRDRVECGRTGAQWALDSLTDMGNQGTADERCRSLTLAMARQQKAGTPVHQWELASIAADTDLCRESFRTVRQVMSTDLFTVAPEDLIDLAASMMDWKHIRHVPVEDTTGRLVGLLSHRQLLRLLARRTPGEEPAMAQDIMTRDPVTTSPETTTLEAIQVMRAHRVSCLPVVHDQKLVGIVTERDFIGITIKLLDRWLGANDPPTPLPPRP